MAAAFEGMFGPFYEMLPNDLPGDESRPKVEQKDISIKGVDGNDLKLHVFRKAGAEREVLPCVIYMHGGGMLLS